MENMDIRVLSTNNRIKAGLIETLADKQLYQVKDKDIISAAQVSASSYYKYYADKSDVVKNLEFDLLAEFKKTAVSDSKEWHKLHASPSKKNISKLMNSNITNIISFFQNNRKAITVLVSKNGDLHFRNDMVSVLANIAKRLIIYYYKLYDQQIEKSFKLDIIAQRYALAILEPLFYWLAHYDSISIRDVQKLIIDTTLYSPYDMSTRHL